MAIYITSAGSIVFSGALAPFLVQGTATILFGTFVVCLVITLMSSYRGAISGLPAPALVVLVAIGSAIALHGDELFMTMVATMMVSGFVAGTCFLMIWRFRLANLIRFIPFSVAGGFLAGTGGALCLAGLSLMGVTPEWPIRSSFQEPSALWKWVPGIAYGLCLFLAAKRWSSSLLLPVSFASIAALYHLGLLFVGISGDEARAMGLLFAGVVEGGLWPAFGPGDLAHVDWATVAKQIPNMLVLNLVILLSLVMYLSGIELAANVELEWNREFRAAGLGGLLAGLGGSPAGVLSTAASMISHKLNAESRLTGVVASLVLGSALLWGDAVLMLIPVPLMAGLVFFIGLALLDEWLIKCRGVLPWAEYAIILSIFVIIVGFGFLEGVGIGMVATTVFFAIRLSRAELVEAEFTAREHASKKIRSIPDRAILWEEGALVKAFRLRGYIFFGSVYPLVERIKHSMRKGPPPACILLDFSAVAGIDFSAMNALCAFVKVAQADGTRVVLSAASEQFKDRLSRVLPPSAYDTLLLEPDADRALEQCEDIVVAARKSDPNDQSDLRHVMLERVVGDMERHLDRQILFEELVHEIRDWLEPREYDTGETLAAIGEPLQGLQLLMAGRASVYDSTGARLFQCGPGDAVEPRGAFGARAATATTVADEPCRTMMLTPAARRRLEEHDALLLLTLYGYLLTVEDRAAPTTAVT